MGGCPRLRPDVAMLVSIPHRLEPVRLFQYCSELNQRNNASVKALS